MRRAEVAAQEEVGGVLVLVALGDLRLDPGAVERAAQEQRLDGDARDAHVAGRLQPDLVEGGGEDVARRARPGLAERLGPGPRALAGRAERADGQRDLLGLGQAEPRPADLRDESDDGGVVGGVGETLEDAGQREPASRLEAADQVRRRPGGETAREVELEQQLAVVAAGSGTPHRPRDPPDSLRNTHTRHEPSRDSCRT